MKCDSLHVNNQCNYGLFLSEEKHAYAEAEVLYRRVLDIAPTHANTLYNYAVMLDTHCSRKPEAEGLYRRALQADPNHSFALYNLAVLLEEVTLQQQQQQQRSDGEGTCPRAKIVKIAVFCRVRYDDHHDDAQALQWCRRSSAYTLRQYQLTLMMQRYGLTTAGDYYIHHHSNVVSSYVIIVIVMIIIVYRNDLGSHCIEEMT